MKNPQNLLPRTAEILSITFALKCSKHLEGPPESSQGSKEPPQESPTPSYGPIDPFYQNLESSKTCGTSLNHPDLIENIYSSLQLDSRKSRTFSKSQRNSSRTKTFPKFPRTFSRTPGETFMMSRTSPLLENITQSLLRTWEPPHGSLELYSWKWTQSASWPAELSAGPRISCIINRTRWV